MKNTCLKCGQEHKTPASAWCNTCRFLLRLKCDPVAVNIIRGLGLRPNLEMQEQEAIPHVLHVEQWPELFQQAQPVISRYNRFLSPRFN